MLQYATAMSGSILASRRREQLSFEETSKNQHMRGRGALLTSNDMTNKPNTAVDRRSFLAPLPERPRGKRRSGCTNRGRRSAAELDDRGRSEPAGGSGLIRRPP